MVEEIESGEWQLHASPASDIGRVPSVLGDGAMCDRLITAKEIETEAVPVKSKRRRFQ